MKKLTFILLQVLFLNYIYGQCTPNSNYADSSWGIWPDTTTNFAPANLNSSYSQTVDFKVPNDAGLLDPAYNGFPIGSITLDNVNNLPPGISYVCDNSTCGWNADDLGCALMSGTPTVTGTFDITLDVTVNISSFFGNIPVPQSFGGYRIIVNGPLGIFNNELTFLKAIPNPANQSSVIHFNSPSISTVNFKLINILGEVVQSSLVESKIGENKLTLNTSSLKNGVYIYSIYDGTDIRTNRLVINH